MTEGFALDGGVGGQPIQNGREYVRSRSGSSDLVLASGSRIWCE